MIKPSYDEVLNLKDNYSVIPIYKEIYADAFTPINLLRKIAGKSDKFFLLESIEGGEKWARYSFIGFNPKARLSYKNGTLTVTGEGARVVKTAKPYDALRQYLADYKTPQWVAWELTKKETKGKEGRTNKFLPDPDVRGAKAYTGDYTKSGYDRGHMAPAADMKWSKQAMKESFYMSNICPQNPNLNRGDWNDLEEKSRQWAKKYGAVYIACGPIYDTKRPKRIGNNKVAVPHAFYKVILINDKKNPQAIGFIFPNSAGHKPLKKYIVTVDSVEKRTNIDFFPALPDEVENRIEAERVQELP